MCACVSLSGTDRSGYKGVAVFHALVLISWMWQLGILMMLDYPQHSLQRAHAYMYAYTHTSICTCSAAVARRHCLPWAKHQFTLYKQNCTHTHSCLGQTLKLDLDYKLIKAVCSRIDAPGSPNLLVRKLPKPNPPTPSPKQTHVLGSSFQTTVRVCFSPSATAYCIKSLHYALQMSHAHKI